MSSPNPWDRIGTRKRARFLPQPHDMPTLRPELLPLVGEVFEWQCSTYVDEPGFPYFGQHVWTTTDPRWLAQAVPDEALADA